jgi:hypothetical protein
MSGWLILRSAAEIESTPTPNFHWVFRSGQFLFSADATLSN